MKKILTILLSIVFVLSITNCDSYLDVNKNPDAPDYVDSYLKLAPITQEMQGLYYDQRAIGTMVQMMGTNSYTNFANHYYSVNSDAGAEYWRVAYFLHGINLEEMINQCLANNEYAFAGIGMVIKAFDWDLIVKYHGDIPFKEKYNPSQTVFPYDSPKDVYPEVRKLAYQAIKYIEMEEADMSKYGTLISANDYIYKGNAVKWKKFAYAILARNYISLSNKTDFISSGFADSAIYCAQHAFESTADDAVLEVAAEGETKDLHPNFWGVYRSNIGYSSGYGWYFQNQYAVQTLGGTVPIYDENTGERMPADADAETRKWYPYELNPTQIISDTIRSVDGHLDPRIAVLLGFEEKRYSEYKITDTFNIITSRPNPGVGDNYAYDTVKLPYTEVFPTEKDYVKNYMSKRFLGGAQTTRAGSISVSYGGTVHYAPSFYGISLDVVQTPAVAGYGRWLYRDGAPYIISTYAEMKFITAEAYWKKGDKANALQALKDGVAAHMDFCEKYIVLPTNSVGGDKITKATFRTLANEYLASPYVGGLTVGNLTLSHIMMQKWVTLYPWGAHEAFVDMRKYHWDIDYTGDYPKSGNGWTIDRLDQKWDSNAAKVYKGFYLRPSRAGKIIASDPAAQFNLYNEGAPCYRIRPRYNSEYIWNVPSLNSLKPIQGTAPNYQCSIPWFAYPGDVPETL
ncbi:MAG: SusD/RagB family nutrient-binding outer membrane lipoprotein [Prevotellaceae bacterium]|jgi:hypothetical protein|nr:SusD/RagB family nutrient-binding outer membrane lipoprotein [Prevotellaceae bacterium]